MLTDGEKDFLTRVKNGSRLGLADRIEDRLRQKLRRLGYVEVLKNPRRWSITEAGAAALLAVGASR